MTGQFSRNRRFALAAAALVISAVLFRPMLAQALVVRGDDYLYRSNVRAAKDHYLRALFFDRNSEEAADRYVFAALLEHRSTALADGLGLANTYLAQHPESTAVLEDRALCHLRLKEYGAAYRDFKGLAERTGAARNYVFAGWAAWYSGQRLAAKQMWLLALRRDPAFRPARSALRRISQA